MVRRALRPLTERVASDSLVFSACARWLEGGWSDVDKTHGIPSVSAVNSPCPFCATEKPSMR
eukprot:7837325-Pyramimonas_sp.AAC.1